MTRDASRSRRFSPRLGRTAAAALAASAALGLTGCSYINPIQTDHTFPPADGVEANLGDLKVTNLLVVAQGKGAPGTVIGSVANRGTTEGRITVAGQDGGGAVTKPVPAGGVLNLQEAGISVPNVPAGPGEMTQLTLSTPGTGSEVTLVPVMGQEGIYATITPGAPAAGAPAATATPEATASTQPATPTPTS